MVNNLTQFSLHNMLIWIVSFSIIEFPMRYFYLNIVGGKNVEKWYNFKDFNIYNVIAGDLFYVLVGIIITYRIYNYYFKNHNNILKFFAVFLVVQFIGDISFYNIVSNIPNTYNTKWINFFKNYGKTSGINAVFGDSIYIAIWTIVAYSIRNFSLDILLSILFSFIFIVSAIAEM
jgi:hypothetical protein|tara:strand:- start:9459 stop:9983 length:525 start_codon:yes stop_codon:yes gene_type:complete